MAKPRVPLDPVADLKRRLRGASSGRAIRSGVRRWWNDHDLANHGAAVAKHVACALLAQRMPEAKHAGIEVLHRLGDQLRAADLAAFARLFDDGHLASVPMVDGFCKKVLVALLDRDVGREQTMSALVDWRNASTCWQRRAACLAFVKLAPRGDELPGVTSAILRTCGTVVWSPERLDQTAVGGVLRELWTTDDDRVEAFFRRHARFMSRECARTAVGKLSASRRAELLAHHRRATGLHR